MSTECAFVSDDRWLLEAVRSGDITRFAPDDKAIIEKVQELNPDGEVIQLTSLQYLDRLQAENKAGKRETEEAPVEGPAKEGLVDLSTENLPGLIKAADQTVHHFEETIKIDKQRAQFVRSLRVEDKRTWRSIAAICALDWGGDWESNQLAGMVICRKSAIVLKEDYKMEPWN